MNTKAMFVLSCLSAAVSCNSLRVTDERLIGGSVQGEKGFWGVAVCFPDGYDWMKDSYGGNIDTRILLFRDSSLVLDINTSRNGPIYPDGDLHCVAGGHLFSRSNSNDGHTSLYRDGTLLFSFDGAESIDWIVPGEDGLITLGSKLDNNGWSFRKDGGIILEENQGNLLSPLYEDDGELCFAWGTPITSSSGETMWRYFIRQGESRKQIIPNSDISGIYCIRSINGKVHYLASSSLLDEVLWEEDGAGSSVVEGCKTANTGSAGFLTVNGKLTAHFKVKLQLGTVTILCWDYFTERDRSVYMTAPGTQLCSDLSDDYGLNFATSAQGQINGISVHTEDGQSYPMPENYLMISGRAFCCDGNDFFIALNDRNAGMQPVVVSGTDTIRFKFNGYFTELALP